MLGVCVLCVGILILTQLSSANHDSSPVETSEGLARHVRGATFDNPLRFIGHDMDAPPNAWRDLLVRSVVARWIIHPDSAGVTGTPLPSERLEGPARRIRKISGHYYGRYGARRLLLQMHSRLVNLAFFKPGKAFFEFPGY